MSHRLRRHRTSSAGSYSEGGPMTNGSMAASSPATDSVPSGPTPMDWQVARELLQILLQIPSGTTSGSYHPKGFLHQAAAAVNANANASVVNPEDPSLLYMAKCLLDRCRALDEYEKSSMAAKPFTNKSGSGGAAAALSSAPSVASSKSSSSSSSSSSSYYWQERFLTQTHPESGYTPLHAAVMAGNLAAILLFLQYPTVSSMAPMAVLHAGGIIASSSSSASLSSVYKVVDAEGLNPLELLNKLQTSQLKHCRHELELEQQQQRRGLCSTNTTNNATGSGVAAAFRSASDSNRRRRQQQQQTRSTSFDIPQAADDEDEFHELREHLQYLGMVRDGDDNPASGGASGVAKTHNTGFEVVTFGRPHHCALGVISGGSGASTTTTTHHLHHHAGSSSDDNTATKKTDGGAISTQTSAALAAASFRPQRVQEFAQERVLRDGSAVSVAAAAHHTLVACRNGHLYVFGLNKGGRLGLGDDCPAQCPLPRRIFASLKRKHVKAIAAAENHSLCVTSDGMVWAWGSNQFGQLGDSSTNNNGSGSGSSSSSTNNSSRSIPKQVEELKQIPCCAVAAGERHSVALSQRGEVYVWGSNASGQLGVARRSGNQKVQRVEALWGGSGGNNTGVGGGGAYQSHRPQRKVALAIAAADQSTLVLTAPTAAGFSQVNSVYWWGHGNHAPMRVPFDTSSSNNSTVVDDFALHGAMTTSRWINPVAIACGKYHNVAVTSDGRVYTWGTCSEALGHRGGTSGGSSSDNASKSTSSSRLTTSSPQLVTGMLPENGGGFAVAVSASEHHTAVVTNTGALFTWGAAHGKNVMGHKGVRWQPNPKRVPGVHRAVHVAVAKEHTVVLIGTTFPTLKPVEPLGTLEDLAARTAAQYVDMFNVLPILIMAEHTQCDFLVDYCNEFVRQNLDGVLNVGKKSVLNQYLQHMLSKSNSYRMDRRFRDGQHHPFVADVITAGNKDKSTSDQDCTSFPEEWVLGCRVLFKSPVVRQLLEVAAERQHEEDFRKAARGGRGRRSSSCTSESDAVSGRNRSCSVGSEQDGTKTQEGTLDRIINQTANMDISTTQLAEEKSRWLGKEIRSVRKKLGQILKLRESESKSIVLTAAEQAKVDRKPVLEAELQLYETALDEVEKKIRELLVEEGQDCKPAIGLAGKEEKTTGEASDKSKRPSDECVSGGEDKIQETSFVCDICSIKCPDKTSFELHQNGRKHRNRLAQVAEEEKLKAAESIMAQKQKEQVKSTAVTPPIVNATKKNPWGASQALQPKFKLPPPPHPVVAQVQTPGTTSQESFPSLGPSRASQATAFTSILREQEGVSRKEASPILKSPAASKASATSSPWATTPSAKSPSSLKSVTPTAWATPSAKSPSTPKATAGARPTPTPVPNRLAPFHLHYATTSSNQDQRNSYSLADFLAPPKPASTPPTKMGASTFAWNAANASLPPAAPTLKKSSRVVTKSLAQIQAEEVDFKSREDRAYKSGDGAGTKWFIERRERADSLHAIQQAAVQERETQLIIEEQLQIEAQIRKELEEQRKKEQQAQTAENKAKNNPKKRPKKKNPPKRQESDESTTTLDVAEPSSGGQTNRNNHSKPKNNSRRGGGRKGGGSQNQPPGAQNSSNNIVL